MPLNRVEHDASLQGDGNPGSRLEISDRGFILLDESENRMCFMSDRPLATTIGGNVIIPFASLNPNEVAPHEHMTVVDDAGYMATITVINAADDTATCQTYYLPPVKNGGTSFLWQNINGNITDNASFMSYMGDKTLFQSAGNNFVNALRAIENLIGLTPVSLRGE
ncbi:hypothetical protein AGMMS49995_11010 [Endomicrobiia bacterium]|nr:hypothetical protein AGMMS49995_11010 [Endomicrobiia bacterium]